MPVAKRPAATSEEDQIPKAAAVVEEKEEAEESTDGVEEVRELLQLDVDLEKLEWTISYIDPHKRSLLETAAHTIKTELLLHNSLATMTLRSDSSISAELCTMDMSLRECGSFHHNGGVTEEKEAYIIHQNLYYKKTKPPRVDGGTMDTRRASQKDTIFKFSFSYSREGIKGKGCQGSG